MIGLDPIAREREGIEGLPIAGGIGGLDLGSSHLETDLVEVEAVELPGQLDQGAVAAGRDVRDDGAHDLLDVGRRLALGGEKGAETLVKIGGTVVEADRHCPVLGPCPSGR